MQKLLFIAVMVVAVVGITSRYHLNKLKAQLGESEASESLSETLKDKNAQVSLSQAFSQVMAQTPHQAFRPPVPSQPQHTIMATPSAQTITAQVDTLVKQIQEGTPDSAYAFEKALTLTSAPENEQFRLTILQSAITLVGDNAVVRNAALSAALGTIVQSSLDRDVVAMAYKIYLQNSVDPMLTYNDTSQILNSQSDSEVKSRITFDCVNKFPQLRERLQ